MSGPCPGWLSHFGFDRNKSQLLEENLHPFQVGQEYPRSELLEFVGSKQQQAGVLWGAIEPGCLIVTSGGRHGKKVGYSDERLPDGSWWYFGQGRVGDHLTTNSANAKLAGRRHSVLLFTTREPTVAEVRERGNYQKLFAFQGVFNVCDEQTTVPMEGTRKGNKLLRFRLLPVASGFDPAINSSAVEDFRSLREQVVAQARQQPAAKRISVTEYRHRSQLVKKYALSRAKGRCEACGNQAPFLDENGNGFLEVHHILRLADDGIDAPENVIAICPNCHRRAHYSIDRLVFREKLIAAVLDIEQGHQQSGL